MKTSLRVLAAVVGFFALGVQFYIIAAPLEGTELTKWIIEYFCFFTILTNCLAALAMALPVIAPRSGPGRFFDRPSVRTAIASYIVIVAAVYHLILRKYWDPKGWGLVADVLLHYVTPAMFVLDWLVFVPKGQVPWRTVVTSLAFPLAYVAWTLVHGAQTNWYPYPFFDVATLGWEKVFMNVAGLLGVFLAVTVALTGANRLLRSRQAVGAEAASS
jgi:hypothetical protein